MTQATIRSAHPQKDAEACAAIYAPSVEGSPTSFEERPPDADEISARIERISATHPWLVAEREGEILGYAYACEHRSRPAYRWSVEVSVYVSADHHGKGHGRRLYESLFDDLRERGFRMAYAGITLPNEASVALHEKLGFEPIGVYRRIGWKAGAWRDVGWWQLELSPGAEDPPAEPG